jgi:hypothetical protein
MAADPAEDPLPADRPIVRTAALRAALAPLREPRRLLAIALISVTGGFIAALLIARGEQAGSDALAYWAGVRIWLDGGDPWHPGAPFMPYVYAPWSLLLFVPWAFLPWDVAWFFWRGLNVLLLLWSAEWAYRRHPLATAGIIAALALPIATTLDTGNITLVLALCVWAAQFVGPRLGGALWAFAASLKWFPALLFAFLPPRARLWGVAAGVVAGVMALATWPQTLIQIDIAIHFPRPLRLDYFLLLWAAVPWVWRHPEPLWWLGRDELPRVVGRARARASASWRAWRESDRRAELARATVGQRLRAFFGVG